MAQEAVGRVGAESVKAELEISTLALEREKVQLLKEASKLEQRKLDLQESSLSLEKVKARWTSLSILASTVIAIAGLLYNGHLQRNIEGTTATHQRDLEAKTAADNFKLKAAEIVMNADGPESTKNKAAALEKLFPEELENRGGSRRKLSDAVIVEASPQGENPDLDGNADAKEALIRLLADHPSQRPQILRDWSTVFTDKWITCFQVPNPCR